MNNPIMRKLQSYPYLIPTISAFICGIFFLALVQGWIIIRLPSVPTYNNQEELIHVRKKNITIHYWHKQAWHHEAIAMIWSTDMTDNIQYLARGWLALLDEEAILDRKVTLQSVLMSGSGHEAYISLDRNPLPRQASTHTKWMFIEGLLKTLRENDIKVQSVRLLVHHQPLYDNHLDFSRGWPLQGFKQ